MRPHAREECEQDAAMVARDPDEWMQFWFENENLPEADRELVARRLLTARARIVPRRLPEAECERRAPAAPVCGPLVRVVQLRLRSQAVARTQSGRAALAA